MGAVMTAQAQVAGASMPFAVRPLRSAIAKRMTRMYGAASAASSCQPKEEPTVFRTYPMAAAAMIGEIAMSQPQKVDEPSALV